MRKLTEKGWIDSEDAEVIGQHSNGLPLNDNNLILETVYHDDNDRYFLHIFGGCMSKYRVKTQGGAYSTGECMTLMDKAGVVDWAKSHKLSLTL